LHFHTVTVEHQPHILDIADALARFLNSLPDLVIVLEKSESAVSAYLTRAFGHRPEFVESLIKPAFDMRILIQISGNARRVGDCRHHFLGLTELHLFGKESRSHVFFSEIRIDPEIIDDREVFEWAVLFEEAFTYSKQHFAARASDADYQRRRDLYLR